MIREYLAYQQKRKGASVNTLTAYYKDLTAWARWANARGLRWSTTTKQDIDSYLADLYDQGKKPATINRHLSSIRGLFAWLQHEGQLSENPARFCEAVKIAERLPVRADLAALDRYLQTEATTKASATVHAMVALMIDAGLRIQEVLDLRKADFDLDTRTIAVNGKGGKQRRVYYTDRTIRHLAAACNWEDGEHVLPQYTQEELRYTFYAEMRKAGIRTHPHAIRHAWATRQLNRGTDIKIVSHLMGHASVKTTERYAKVADSTARAAYYQSMNQA